MKILERKDWEKDFKQEVTCHTCQSKLEIESADIVCTPSSGGNPRDYCAESFHVVCAVCSKQIGLRESSIPTYITGMARDRTIKAKNDAFHAR